MLQGHGTPPTSDGGMVRCLPDCQTRTSCAVWRTLRRWIVQHTRRQHRCVARTPPGTARAQCGCQRCQPCMMLPALHLHCQPCGSCPSHLAQLPARCATASWTCHGANSLDIAQVPPGSMTDAHAAVPTCLPSLARLIWALGFEHTRGMYTGHGQTPSSRCHTGTDATQC